jgi:FtsH-binding integral membrane protein
MLFITQTSLVAANRRDIHRKLGWLAVGLAVVMLVLGWMAALDTLRKGTVPVPGITPASFFAVPVGSLAAFAPLVLLGILNRKRSDLHKRYMLMSTIVLLIPAAARIFLAMHVSPLLAAFAVADMFMLAMLAYDFFQRGKVNRATLIGAAILIASEVGRPLIGGTDWWQAFANSLA